MAFLRFNGGSFAATKGRRCALTGATMAAVRYFGREEHRLWHRTGSHDRRGLAWAFLPNSSRRYPLE